MTILKHKPRKTASQSRGRQNSSVTSEERQRPAGLEETKSPLSRGVPASDAGEGCKIE